MSSRKNGTGKAEGVLPFELKHEPGRWVDGRQSVTAVVMTPG